MLLILPKEINPYRSISVVMEHTISIDDHIWEMAKIEAEKREITTNEIVKKALETYLGIDTKKLPLNTDE